MFTIEFQDSEQIVDTIIALENNLESVNQRLRDFQNYEVRMATAYQDLKERGSSQFQQPEKASDPEMYFVCRKRDSYTAVIKELKKALNKKMPTEK